jgi:site-specific DNA-methyltransferase (adenine-specific)/modification methylase
LLEGRNFIGVEKNEDVALFKKEKIDYIDIAKRRLFLTWDKLNEEDKKYIVQKNLITEFKERI